MAPLRLVGLFLLAHAAAVDRQLKCWGSDTDDQVTGGSPTFDGPDDLTQPVVAVAVGAKNTCVLLLDGQPFCWGANRPWMVNQIPTDLAASKAIAVAWRHACVVSKVGGAVRCWGGGTGAPTQAELDALPAIKDISGGNWHYLFLTETGGVIGLGSNTKGQLDVPTGVEYKAIAAGHQHSCAIKADDNALCWGYDDQDQCKIPSDLGAVKAVAAGERHTCAVKLSDGSAACWGNNFGGETTDGIAAGLYYKSISAGYLFTCGILEDGVDPGVTTVSTPYTEQGGVSCWGDNQQGKKTKHHGMTDISDVRFIASDKYHSCILMGDLPVTTTTVTLTTSTASTLTATTATVTTATVTTATTMTTTSTVTTVTVTTSTSSTSATATTTTKTTATATTATTVTATTSTSSSVTTTWTSTSTLTTMSSTSTSSETSSTSSTTATTTASSTSSSTVTSSTSSTHTTVTITTSSSTVSSTVSSTSSSSSSTSVTSTDSSTTSTLTSTTSSSKTSSTSSRTSSSSSSSTTSSSSVSSSSSSSSTSSSSSSSSSSSTSSSSTTTTSTLMAVRFAYAFSGIDCSKLEAQPGVLEGIIGASQDALLDLINVKVQLNLTRGHCESSSTCRAPPTARRLQSATAGSLEVETVIRADIATVPSSDVATSLQAGLVAGAWQQGALQRVLAVPGLAAVAQAGSEVSLAAAPRLALLWDTKVMPLDYSKALTQVETLLAAVAGRTIGLLEELRETAATNATRDVTTGGLLYGVELNASLLPGLSSGERRVDLATMPDMAGDFQVLLPPSFFTEHLAALGETAALLAHAVPQSFARSLGMEPTEVRAAAVIDVHRLTGPYVRLANLKEPLVMRLPVNYTADMACAYWDNKTARWSTEGVRVHRARTVLGGPLWCEATHLSLFAAIIQGIVQTLQCANFGILNLEAIREIGRGDWYRYSGALIYWFVLAVLLATLCAAALLDKKRAKRFGWRDEWFLTPPLARRRGCEEDAAPEAPQGFFARTAAGFQSLCLPCSYCCGSMEGPLKDALDEVAGNWFEYFGDVRSFCEEILNEVGGDFGGVGSLLQAGRGAMSQMLILASRRKTAATMGLSKDVVTFILDDEDLALYLSTAVNQERLPACATGSEQSGVDWRTTASQILAWRHLREEVCEQVLKHVREQEHSRVRLVCGSVSAIFLSQNPLGSLFAMDMFRTCKQRVLGLATEIQGSLVLACIFFEASGTVRGKQKSSACDVEDPSIGMQIGRLIVITTGSLLLAEVPVILLDSLQTRGFQEIEEGPGSAAWKRQLRVWKVQDMLFWTVGLLYNAGCCFYIILFLANIGDQDQFNWFCAGALAFFEDFVLLPFLLALVVPVLAKMALKAASRLLRVEQSHLVRQTCVRLHENSNTMLPIEGL